MKRFALIFLAVVFLLPLKAWGLDVIPGLKGFGTDTRAAYGAKNDPVICIVNTIAHRSGSLSGATNGNLPDGSVQRNGISVAAGSLLECLNYTPPANTGKIILFEVSGTINATTKPYDYNSLGQYITIAGQTAPSPGITLRNIVFSIRSSDTLVQHIRSRVGDAELGYLPRDRRSINVISKSGETVKNVVVDHVTATWGIDTCFTVWQGGSTSNVTISNCLIGEGLHNSLHPDGPHSKGLALQIGTTKVSAITNLLVSNYDRNPYVRWGSKVVVNNYVYNPGIVFMQVLAHLGTQHLASIGNVSMPGPSTAKSGYGLYHATLANDPTYSTNWDNSKIYFLDNVWNTIIQSKSSDWSKVQNKYYDDVSPYMVSGENPETDAPLWPANLIPMSSNEVKSYVLSNAGARPSDRDSVDTRLINDVTSGSGRIINSPSEVGGWPNLAMNHRTLILPPNPHGDEDNDGYTNCEEWLHRLAAQAEGKNIGSSLSPPIGLSIKKN